MFGSTRLEAATGLIFIFLLLSVLRDCRERDDRQRAGSRAKCLWKGIEAMLESSQLVTAAENSWTVKLYEHAILRPLMPLKSKGKESETGPRQRAFLFPPKSFAAALLDITGINTPTSTTGSASCKTGSPGSPLETPPPWPPGQGRSYRGSSTKSECRWTARNSRNTWKRCTAKLNTNGGAPSAGVGGRLAEIASRITDGTYDDGTARAGASRSEAFKDQALELVKPSLEKLASDPDADALRDIIHRIPTTGTAAVSVYQGLIRLLPRMNADETAHAMVKCFADNIAVNHARKALADLEHRLRKKLKPEIERELGVRPELGKPDLTAALHNLLDQADGDFEKLKTNVEDWFNHSMERVSGWYKRKTILVHVCIAILTIFMNIDALVVLRHISADPDLREEPGRPGG